MDPITPGQSTPDDETRTTRENGPATPHAPAAIFTRPRRRWLKQLALPALVAGSVLCGALLQKTVTSLGWFAPKAPPHSVTPDRILGPITLNGPGGPVTLPMPHPVVVNVWLQNCRDCLPAFEAMKQLDLNEPNVTTVNVAYGSAEYSWAVEHHVEERLVFDPTGMALVRPLGIGSFTTLVIDENGFIRLKDRPDRPGYAHRVVGALRALNTMPRQGRAAR